MKHFIEKSFFSFLSSGNLLNKERISKINIVAILLVSVGLMFSSSSWAEPSVSGQTISWPDDGWYQVQIQGDPDSDVCQGDRSCEVDPGTYLVINLSTGDRFYDVVVSGPSAPSARPTVMGNTISWQDNGWYQVQVQGDFDSDVCQGDTSCDVDPGTYLVINITTGERFYDIVVAGDGGGNLPTILQVLEDAGNFTGLIGALQSTGLDQIFSDANLGSELTLFAPNDDAIALLDEETLNTLQSDNDVLTDLLAYHVLPGNLDSSSLAALSADPLVSGNGDNLAIRVVGEELFVNESRVIVADVQALNGVIHVIDSVLIPPVDNEPPISPMGTILEVAEATGLFSQLITALEVAGLDGALNNPDDVYTVFAPTDNAIAALGDETIDALAANPDVLRDVLLFHLIPGVRFQSADFADVLGFDIGAGNGGVLTINQTDEGFTVNGVHIIIADVLASNGVIHVIDAVLAQ